MPHPARAAETPSDAADFVTVFARFAAGLQAAALPAAAITAARNNLLDTIAGAIAGSAAPGIGVVAALVGSWGGAPQATPWCGAARAPAHDAAWINATLAAAGDDDGHDELVLHAGAAVIPAALAAAELDPTASGGDLLAGIAAGLELVCRLGLATTIGSAESGFSYTALFGYPGAAAAAARVLRLDAARTAHAIGIACSQAAGSQLPDGDAALARWMQPGFAARAGLVAVQLAQRGAPGAKAVFEGAAGLFHAYLRGQYDPGRLRDRLGERLVLAGLSYRPYPGSRLHHTAIDAALAIRARAGFDAQQVRRIEARVGRQAYDTVCTPAELRRAPRTAAQARFSLPWCVAAALTDGPVGLRHFTEEALQRPDLLTLARRVDCRSDPGIGRDGAPTALRVETRDGVLTARVEHPKGHPSAPLGRAEFAAKLTDALALGAAWPAGTAERLLDAIDRLQTLPRGGQIAELLAR